MEDKKLKQLERELAKKYDKHCHGPNNMGYTIWLKEPFKFGENVEPDDMDYFDTDRMEINGFYAWKNHLYLTDGCGDAPLEGLFSDNEAKKFLDYISDEKNLKFEH